MTQIKLPFFVRNVAKILDKNWLYGNLTIGLPTQQVLRFNGKEPGPDAVIDVKNYRFIKRILASGDIGFCDGYKFGEWDTPDLNAVLEAFSLNLDRLDRLLNGHGLVQKINNWLHAFNKNSKSGSKRNIFAHYDLGNSFYSQWLDHTMTYSAALYDSVPLIELEAAQTHKYAELARLVDLKPGQSVLEIGCGWGGFAEYAAQNIGAHITCLTISQAQFDYAVERMKRKGLSHLVDIKLMDYRDISGQFDSIVSIEMFEAVGEDYWPTYFDQVKSCLKSGGKAGLQIITIRDDLFDDYKARTDFIQKYVFPGGMLPSLKKLMEQAKRTGLNMLTTRQFGLDYSRTLKEWRDRFEKAWREGRIKGFDDPFRKLWLFYLAYCAAGFQTKRTDVIHLQLIKN